MNWTTYTVDNKPDYGFPAIPAIEATDEDLYEDDLDECFGLGEDVSELVEDEVAALIYYSDHPQEYAVWAAQPWEPDGFDGGEPPGYVTVLAA